VELLIIEDESRTRDLLAFGLVEAGFSVDSCDNGVDGLARALSGGYDAIVLDIMMPGMDGWALLAGLRAHDRKTPAIILSARDAVQDRILGLTLGADDYLVKPFAFDELLARLRALLRRSSVTERECLDYADLRLMPRGQSAERAGRVIELTGKEYQLLELLLMHHGEVLSRAVISDRVWQMGVDSDSNVIEVNIRRLRGKVDDPHERKLIHTVKGRGYVLR
jgi:two-component system, OmpR family, copper resistance phosphate regulon response regulator CusR